MVWPYVLPITSSGWLICGGRVHVTTAKQSSAPLARSALAEAGVATIFHPDRAFGTRHGCQTWADG